MIKNKMKVCVPKQATYINSKQCNKMNETVTLSV